MAERFSRLASFHEADVEGGVFHGEAFERETIDIEVELLFSRLCDADGLPRKTHKLMHKRCFTGSEMLEWMRVNTHLTRPIALQLGQTFIDLLIMHAVVDDDGQHAPFSSETLYRFYCDDDPFVLNCKRRFSGVARSPATILDKCVQSLAQVWERFLFACNQPVCDDYSVLRRSREFQSFENAAVCLQIISPQELKERGDSAIAWWVTVYNIMTVHSALIEGRRRSRLWLKPKAPFAYLIGGESWTLDDIELGILRGNKARASSNMSLSKEDIAFIESSKPFWPKNDDYAAKRRAAVHSELRGLAAFGLLPNRPIPPAVEHVVSISNSPSFEMCELVPILDTSSARDGLLSCLRSAREQGAIFVTESDDCNVEVKLPLFMHSNRADFAASTTGRSTAEIDIAVARWLLHNGALDPGPEDDPSVLDQYRLLQKAVSKERSLALRYQDLRSLSTRASPEGTVEGGSPIEENEIRLQHLRRMNPHHTVHHTVSEKLLKKNEVQKRNTAPRPQSERPDAQQHRAAFEADPIRPRAESSSTSLRVALDSVVSGIRHRLPSFHETHLPSNGEDSSDSETRNDDAS